MNEDLVLNDEMETPQELINFLNEIDEICKKYNLSISHEDCEGGFIIERYNAKNIKWLKSAMKGY